MSRQRPNTTDLLSRYDLDPGRWRPLFYGTKIDVNPEIGGEGVNTVKINNQPFIMTMVTHKIVGDLSDPETFGLYQDGMYDVEFKDEQSNYQVGPIAADLLFGSIGSGAGNGYSMPLPMPIPFSGAKTLTFRVINRVLRTLPPGSTTFRVEFAIHGVADWGPLTTT